jgi:acyl carrier protein
MQNEHRLIAYVVQKANTTVAARDLRVFVGNYLPEYMVPSGIVFVDALPLTESGKVDRDKLPAPLRQPTQDETHDSPSMNPEEAFLVRLWVELLGVSKVGTSDHFLELGGDSLFAVQIMARVWDQFDIELPVLSVFEHPTISQLAAVIRQERVQARSEGK